MKGGKEREVKNKEKRKRKEKKGKKKDKKEPQKSSSIHRRHFGHGKGSIFCCTCFAAVTQEGELIEDQKLLSFLPSLLVEFFTMFYTLLMTLHVYECLPKHRQGKQWIWMQQEGQKERKKERKDGNCIN